MVAGFFHDHIFVGSDDGETALQVLCQVAKDRPNIPLQEKCLRGILRGLRTISDTPVKQRCEISPVKGKIRYFSPP